MTGRKKSTIVVLGMAVSALGIGLYLFTDNQRSRLIRAYNRMTLGQTQEDVHKAVEIRPGIYDKKHEGWEGAKVHDEGSAVGLYLKFGLYGDGSLDAVIMMNGTETLERGEYWLTEELQLGCPVRLRHESEVQTS